MEKIKKMQTMCKAMNYSNNTTIMSKNLEDEETKKNPIIKKLMDEQQASSNLEMFTELKMLNWAWAYQDVDGSWK